MCILKSHRYIPAESYTALLIGVHLKFYINDHTPLLDWILTLYAQILSTLSHSISIHKHSTRHDSSLREPTPHSQVTCTSTEVYSPQEMFSHLSGSCSEETPPFTLHPLNSCPSLVSWLAQIPADLLNEQRYMNSRHSSLA